MEKKEIRYKFTRDVGVVGAVGAVARAVGADAGG